MEVTMSKARIALLTILAFLAAAVVGYLVVTVTVIGLWAATGVHDQDGGGAMAVGLVIAPICALIFGAMVAVWIASKLLRKRAGAPSPSPEVEARDARFGVQLLCVLGGFWLGWQIADFARDLLTPYYRHYVVAAIAFAGTHKVLPVVFAMLGYFLSRRYGVKQ